MFGRRSSPAGDVVAAAQHRLAAIAQAHQAQAHQGQAHQGQAHQGQAHQGQAHRAQTDPPLTHRGTEGDLGHETPEPPLHRSSPTVDLAASRVRHALERRTDLGRFGLTGQQVTVAAICLALIVVLAAWWALRSVPHADQVTLSGTRVTPTAPVSQPSGPVLGPETPTGTTSGPATGRLVVDVAGRVRHPGIVELPVGSRVVDAIAAAGGTRPGVALTTLNLARILVDGEQILVGVRVPGWGGASPPPVSSAVSPTTIAPLELNAATLEQLDTLPGIGPVTAQAIVQWRMDNGPFTTVNELLEVSGIGDVTLSDIRPYVYV